MIRELLNRPWFTRSWVIQEVALAKECTVHIAQNVFRWEAVDLLILGLAWLDREKHGLGNSWVLRTRAAQITRHLQFFKGDWSSRSAQSQRGDFLQLLKRLAFSTECSDPRDLVYAFLSLQHEKVLPRADYTISLKKLYINTSAKLAESSQTLDIFGFTRYNANSPDRIPRWVIDWRINKSIQGSPIAGPQSSFNACGRFKYHQSRNISRDGTGTELYTDGLLSVRGKVIANAYKYLALKELTLSSAALEIMRKLVSFALRVKVAALSHLGDTCDALQECSLSEDDMDIFRRVVKTLLLYDRERDTSERDTSERDCDHQLSTAFSTYYKLCIRKPAHR